MKIAVGTIKHESNSFNPDLTRLEEFQLRFGVDILQNNSRLVTTSLGGIVDFFQARQVEIIPLVFALADTEGGLVSLNAYQKIKEGFLSHLKRANNLDGICLDLHGSMTVEGFLDAEGDLLQSARQIVGAETPIVAALDMHAMVSEQMIKHADGFVAYRTAPHIDKYETGKRAANMLYDSIREGYRLTMAGVLLPLLVSGEQSESAKFPMNELIRELARVDLHKDLICTSYCLGFPWSDVEFNSASTIVVTRDDLQLAGEKAIYLANQFWNKHRDFKFTTEAYPIETALRLAQETEEGPVIITDSGDNPGAGGSENITYPLEEMLRLQIKDALFAVIVDQNACEICLKSGVGAKLTLSLGKRDIAPAAGSSMITGRVKYLGEYQQTTVVVFQTSGIDLIITAKKMMMTDPEFLCNLGLSPTDYHLLLLKSGYLDPKYQPYTKRTILGLAPGYTNQIFAQLPYRNLSRPIFPLDKDFAWSAKEKLLFSR